MIIAIPIFKLAIIAMYIYIYSLDIQYLIQFFRMRNQSDFIHKLKIEKEKTLSEANKLRIQLKNMKVCEWQMNCAVLISLSRLPYRHRSVRVLH